MDYYQEEFAKLSEEFHEVMHDYPLFSEMIDDIEEHDIKEINELLGKHDEFYLKKAIDKLKKLIEYIKKMSSSINKEYETFDKLAGIWEKLELKASEDEIKNINARVRKANSLIKKHDLKSLSEANRIMEDLIKNSKK